MSNEYQDWKRDEIFELKQELDRTRKELEQSEICCTEWEKQALDYKAENIGLQSKLDIAVDALKWIAYDENGEQDGLEEFAISQMMEKADEAINQIIALEQKDNGGNK